MRKPPNYPACIDGNPWYERISNERLENMSTKNLLGLYRKYRTVNYGSIPWETWRIMRP